MSNSIHSLYIVGSLRNPEIPIVANALEELGLEAFDDWYGAGPEADDKWKEHEIARGRDYGRALEGPAARHIFEFDKKHLDRCEGALLVMPAGRSGHLELGYVAGCGKPTFILMDNPERWDVMAQFATKVFFSKEEMLDYFKFNNR